MSGRNNRWFGNEDGDLVLPLTEGGNSSFYTRDGRVEWLHGDLTEYLPPNRNPQETVHMVATRRHYLWLMPDASRPRSNRL